MTSEVVCLAGASLKWHGFRSRYLVSWPTMHVPAFFEESLDRGLEFSGGNEHLEGMARAYILG
jgi:hypothetical protein